MPVTIDGSGNITTSSGFIRSTGKFYAPNTVVQRVYQQAQTDANHLSIATTSQTTLALTATITPSLATSKIMVHWYSMMAYGAANATNYELYRSIGGGAYSGIVVEQRAYPPGPYYGWCYHSGSWQHLNLYYFDTPNTTQAITYQLRYSLESGSSTNYVVHQSGQYYGWILTEIAQ